MSNAGQLLTLRDAASRVGVSERTLRRRIRDGSLPAVRLGPTERHPLRIVESELEEWVFERPRDAA